jgi:hypothetical protein
MPVCRRSSDGDVSGMATSSRSRGHRDRAAPLRVVAREAGGALKAVMAMSRRGAAEAGLSVTVLAEIACARLNRFRDAGAAMKRLACFTRSGAGHTAGQRSGDGRSRRTDALL